MKRRDFIRSSGLATAGTFLVPAFLKPFESWAITTNNKPQTTNRILVVVQLSGGNDGLNTVIPYGNDEYYRVRPSIAVAKDDVIRLNDMQGLNPSMEPLKELYGQGWMSIINNVGYPNPDHSHFRSMDIWHTGSDSNEFLDSGWIGRYLDNECEHPPAPQRGVSTAQADRLLNPPLGGWGGMVIELDDSLSLAVKGEKQKAIALKNPRQLYNAVQNSYFGEIEKSAPADEHSNLGYLYKTLIETQSSAKYIFEKSKTFKSNSIYPPDAFSSSMKQVAELICSGLETRVYYVSLGGFDTHVGQTGKQNRQLKQVADGIAAFMKDLKKNNRLDDVMVMTFSEFGRRVAQNGSNGTDHGTANNLLLFGNGLKKKGIYNDAPDLTDLNDGDLKYKVDFKDVYATILDKWLQADASKVLNKKAEYLGLYLNSSGSSALSSKKIGFS